MNVIRPLLRPFGFLRSPWLTTGSLRESNGGTVGIARTPDLGCLAITPLILFAYVVYDSDDEVQVSIR